MVDLVDQPTGVKRGKVLELLDAGRPVEVPGEVRVLIVIGLVSADHMPAGTPYSPVQCRIQRLGALGRNHPDDLAWLHAAAVTEGEVDQDGGIPLEDLLWWDVGHEGA